MFTTTKQNNCIMRISKNNLRDIKYFTFLGAATLICVSAVLLLGHGLALLLGTTL